MSGKYSYDAFISYSHREPDATAAQAIHKCLERYHIPAKIRKKTGKDKIRRVFRDKEELPLSANLGEDIRAALEKSEFLILICSPNSMASMWVQREVEIFLEYHDTKHIIVVLVDGEPKDVVPKRLLVEETVLEEQTGEDSVTNREIEPLAADLRSKTTREMLQKLKSEKLRMLAMMLGCEYDELKQRHRRYIRRRNGAILTVCFGVLFAFLAYALRQNALIQDKYEEALINQSRYLSQMALDRLEDRDRIGALQILLAALPNEENPKRPIVPEAEYALNSALYSYNHYSNMSYLADRQLELEYLTGDVSRISPEGDYILHIDGGGNVYIINVAERAASCVLSSEDQKGEWINGYFPSETMVVLYNTEEIAAFDTRDGKSLWTGQFPDAHSAHDKPLRACTEDKIIVGTDKWAAVYDLTDGTLLHEEIFFPEALYSDRTLKDVEVNPSGTKAVFGIKRGIYTNEDVFSGIIELDLETYETTYWNVENVEQLRMPDDSNVLILKLLQEEKNFFSYVTQVQFSNFNLDTGETTWTGSASGNYYGKEYEAGYGSFKVGSQPCQQVGVFYVDNQVWIVDLNNGDILFTRSFGDDIVHIWAWNTYWMMVALSDGSVQLVSFSAYSEDVALIPGNKEVTSVLFSGSANTIISVPANEANLIFSTPVYDESITKLNDEGKIGYIGWHSTEDGQEVRTAVFDQYKDDVLSRIEAWRVGEEDSFVKVYSSDISKRITGWYAFSKDLTTLWYVEEDKAYNGEAQLCTYDIVQKEITETFALPKKSLSIEVSSDYGKILMYSYKMLDVLDVETSEVDSLYDKLTETFEMQDFDGASIYDVKLAMEGRYALVHFHSTDSKNALVIWDLELGQLVPVQGNAVTEFGTSLNYNRIAVSDNKNKVAFYHPARKEIQILNLETISFENPIPFVTNEKAVFRFFNEDRYMILYGDTAYLKLWDLEKGMEIARDENRIDNVSGIYTDGSLEYFGVRFGGFLQVDEILYRLTEDGRFCRVADIPGGMISFSAEEIVCQCEANRYGYYKFHTLEELIEKAAEVIGQDLMTEEEKRLYFIE